MQIGIDSFVAATVDAGGRAVDPARHLSELLEAITLADEVGLDVFGIGEHHRREFLDSAPTVMLAAAHSLVRQTPRATHRTGSLSAAAAGPAAGLARCRRHAGLFYSGRRARARTNGCDHRRRTASLSATDRSLS